MRILTRYILREVFAHAAIGVAVFTFILFTRDLGRILELVVRNSAPLPSVAEIFFFTVPVASELMPSPPPQSAPPMATVPSMAADTRELLSEGPETTFTQSVADEAAVMAVARWVAGQIPVRFAVTRSRYRPSASVWMRVLT